MSEYILFSLCVNDLEISIIDYFQANIIIDSTQIISTKQLTKVFFFIQNKSILQ